eukprot:6185307-Pleurochrysis_carterae.AAC.2
MQSSLNPIAFSPFDGVYCCLRLRHTSLLSHSVRAKALHTVCIVSSLSDADCLIELTRGALVWQAVLEAHGGVLSKLSTFQSLSASEFRLRQPPSQAQQLQSYRYISSSTNSDFEPNLTQLTKYNAANGAAPNARSGGSVQLAASADQLLPYANACGILALPQSEVTALKRYAEAIKAAADKHKPIYS